MPKTQTLKNEDSVSLSGHLDANIHLDASGKQIPAFNLKPQRRLTAVLCLEQILLYKLLESG